jgi:DNA-binding MarR family transcriptional regulator
MKMNALTQALKTAGVKLPFQNQRIWQWLKDTGPHTALDIASELKIGQPTVVATLNDMRVRKMIEKTERKDHKGKRIASTYAAIGREYELLPKKVKRGDAGRAVANAAKAAEPERPKFNAEAHLADLTLAELRQVYTFLKGVFK